jgi:hypothetical protein
MGVQALNAVESLVRATAGKPWAISVDSPIGRKQSVLLFSCDEAGHLVGEMTDLFGKQLPLHDLSLSDDSMSWRLEVTRPVKVSLTFHASIEGDAIKGKICSKYPSMAFAGKAPLA